MTHVMHGSPLSMQHLPCLPARSRCSTAFRCSTYNSHCQVDGHTIYQIQTASAWGPRLAGQQHQCQHRCAPAATPHVRHGQDLRQQRCEAAAADGVPPGGDGVVVAPNPEEAQQAAMDATGLGRRQLWFAAIKPPMYTVCIIPVLVRELICPHTTSAMYVDFAHALCAVHGAGASKFLKHDDGFPFPCSLRAESKPLPKDAFTS
jgi:hypothetical protein